jgi:hypothetical protein
MGRLKHPAWRHPRALEIIGEDWDAGRSLRSTRARLRQILRMDASVELISDIAHGALGKAHRPRNWVAVDDQRLGVETAWRLRAAKRRVEAKRSAQQAHTLTVKARQTEDEELAQTTRRCTACGTPYRGLACPNPDRHRRAA